MARLLLFLLFVTFVITGSLAVKSCSDRGRPPSTPSTGDGSALVALRDGSTMMAQQGSIGRQLVDRSEEHTSELQSLMRISYAVFCLKKKKYHNSKNSLTQ